MFTELVSQDSSPETEEDAEETHEILKGRVRTSEDEEAHATHSEEVAMSEEEELKHEQEAAEEKVSDRSPHLVSDTSATRQHHYPITPHHGSDTSAYCVSTNKKRRERSRR